MAKVLVVDDEPMIAALLRFVLEKAGHQVEEARNGVEALAALGVAPEDSSAVLPQVVVLDVMMPVMDGLATAKAMAAHARASKVPILVVTAKGDMRALFEAMPQVAGYFQKPFDPKALREAVARVAA
ncbi:MAG: response regulator transcription factor [Elusimicrobia bacterium]|nr:response regulator transcription factor [Elusimicrobiota bacterium]